MCKHSRGFSRLDLASDSQLATHQNATCVKHAGSWRVMTAGALQDKNYSLARQLSHDSNLLLIPLVKLSHQNALFCKKMTFHIPHLSYYKYSYTHEMLRASRENFERNLRENQDWLIHNLRHLILQIPLLSPSLLTYPWKVHLSNPYLTTLILVRRYLGLGKQFGDDKFIWLM